MQLSNLFQLDWKDFLNGFLMAVIGAVLGQLAGAIDTGELLSINWKQMGIGAASAGIGYIVKRFASNSEGTPLKTESDSGYKAKRQ